LIITYLISQLSNLFKNLFFKIKIKNNMLGLYESTIGMAIAAVCALLNFITIPASINNWVKKGLGVLWLLLAPYASVMFFKAGVAAMYAKDAKPGAGVQWSILIGIFIPIMVGLAIHGWYSVKGEYDAAE
jgi:hypothetical protein